MPDGSFLRCAVLETPGFAENTDILHISAFATNSRIFSVIFM
jgi:hypothetical protein